jgi:2-keto-4-pentenoate hydratase
VESSLTIQHRIGELIGQAIGGWKCSVPNEARPLPLAPIYAPAIFRNSPCTVLATGTTVKIEPEVAFVLGRDLPQRGEPYSDAEIRDAIGETRLVLELIGSRYADPGAVDWAEQLADSIQNQGLFVGPLVKGAMDAGLDAFPVTLRGPGGVLSKHDGRHGDGHPLRPVYWIANFLAARNEGLRAGQIVTTGSYAGAIDVPLGQSLAVEFGDLGTIAVELQRTA